ncbi:hypothetical protein TNCT_542031 [Trichonephila clavata]|uniref:E3 ubiquitin-protein ligase Topors n=1 Tax=Trichonephila clavata TaxID=2740835 RepID=A0A8X6F688_TRICU|nr:hypothetical protein TNCT_542031 [Trichonephila clavata]
MEPEGENNTAEGEELKDKQRECLLLDKEKSQSIASSSNEEKSEDKSTVDNMSENPPEVSENRPGASSPEPNCAICLEPLQNKSFIDSCLHTFCFTCLLEWSKVKPECPLCKQQFKSIVHNVQKDMTFEEYHVSSMTNIQLWSYFGRTEHRFRYPTTLTSSRILERNRSSNQESYENQINSHRMRYAPHSVRRYSTSQMICMPCPFRRRVYAENLWVKPLAKTRVRIATPEFFKSNPACTHRLIPWLNRELVSLWQDNEGQVTFVLELIMSLVVRYNITSEEFLIHIEPYMGNNTHHFIHEFYNFAISPLDMENYDARANYLKESLQNDRSSSSPDSDVIPIFNSGHSTVTYLPESNIRRPQKTPSNRLDRLVLKKKNEDSWESILEPITSAHFPSGSIYAANPGPSTSRIGLFSFPSPEDMNINVTSDFDLTDDEEIQVVDVLKPKHERTPEIVELSSGEDEPKPMTVIDVSSGEEDFSHSEFPVSAYVSASYSKLGSDCSSSDVECVYDADRPSTSKEISDEEQPGPSVESNSKNHERTSLNVPYDEFINNSASNTRKSPKLASAIVRPWAMGNESPHKPLSSELKRHLTSSYVDGSLTESCSDTGHSSERKAKKLKLRSVVAHFSIDTSDSRHDSGHRSSHKKHKDKKKKKKKHMHRHKHRIYSESDSG